MPRFLSGHLCPETSGSFPGSVLGTSAARRGSSMAAFVRHRAGDLRGPAQGRREAAEEVAEPDCGCRLAALARGQRSRPRAGVQVRCALLGWRVRKRLDFTSSETRQNQGGEVESVPPGRGLCPSLGGLQSRAWRLCSVCCGQLPCHTQASRWGGPGTGVAEPSDFPAQPGGQAAPYPVTLTEQILEAGRDITSPPRARAASRHQGSG